jgi:hypothetical protein
MLLIQNGTGAGFRDVLFSALLAMAALDPGVATAQEWPKQQIKLTEQHIRAFLATTNEMAKLVSGADLKDLALANRPDPKVQAQAEFVAKKNGFASLAEFSDVSENILIIFMGIDPQEKFHEPAELIKQSISVLKTDNSVPEKEKKKYHDKLPPLTRDERDKLCLAALDSLCTWAPFLDAGIPRE